MEGVVVVMEQSGVCVCVRVYVRAREEVKGTETIKQLNIGKKGYRTRWRALQLRFRPQALCFGVEHDAAVHSSLEAGVAAWCSARSIHHCSGLVEESELGCCVDA
jgi:hypothetical protein